MNSLDLVMAVALLEEKVFIGTVSSKCDSCNTKSRKHGLEVGRFWKDGVLTPGFTLSPRVVINRSLYLSFNVWFSHWKVYITERKKNKSILYSATANPGLGWRRAECKRGKRGSPWTWIQQLFPIDNTAKWYLLTCILTI